MRAEIHFLPDHQKVTIESPTRLLDICSMAHVMVDSACAGNGSCGHCKIQIRSGNHRDYTEIEKKVLTKKELEDGYRLACQIMVQEDMTVQIPEIHGNSGRKKTMTYLPEGFIADLCEEEESYGIAFDMGTTTVVGILWDLSKGQQLDAEAVTNPQTVHGADVISRIQYSMETVENLQILHNEMREDLISMTKTLCQRHDLSQEMIRRMTFVGNTTMCHLFLGKDPSGLARYPFTPEYEGGYEFDPISFGFPVGRQTKAYVLPGIAGHVGSDISAVMLACDLTHFPGPAIAIDIGTNGEILVSSPSKNRILACSTAAGPAFEGATISCGMRAAKGAIERCRIDDDFHYETIENEPAVGICGSGLIDLIAEMVSSGLILKNGNLLTREKAEEKGLPQALCARLYGNGPKKGFCLCHKEDGEDIVLTQKDIREVQLAKGAILGGMKTMLKKLDLSMDQIDTLFLAGAFGSYINKKSAITMGLLPPIHENRIQSVGNAAGTGASMMLLKPELKGRLEIETKQVEHIELSKDKDFQTFYFESMNF